MPAEQAEGETWAAEAGRTPVMAWAVLVLPLVVMLALVLGVFGVATRPGTVVTGVLPESASTVGPTDPASTDDAGRAPGVGPDGSPTTAGQRPSASTAPSTAPSTAGSAAGGATPGAPTTSTAATSTTGDGSLGPPATSTSSTSTGRRMPASAEDCRHGGWTDLVDDQGRPFRSQGDCVSFANRS